MTNAQNNVKYGNFLFSDILEKVPTKKLGLHAKLLPKEQDIENNIPLIAAGVDDQGCVGYVNEKLPTVLQNILTVSANGVNTGTTFYQKRKFSILQDAYALKLVDEYKQYANDATYLYLTATLNNRFKDNNYSNKAIWNRTKNYQIELPVTLADNIDFDFMENYITAIEKQSICSAIEHKDKVIQITKDVVNAN